jgi:hypothetical protein
MRATIPVPSVLPVLDWCRGTFRREYGFPRGTCTRSIEIPFPRPIRGNSHGNCERGNAQRSVDAFHQMSNVSYVGGLDRATGMESCMRRLTYIAALHTAPSTTYGVCTGGRFVYPAVRPQICCVVHLWLYILHHSNTDRRIEYT